MGVITPAPAELLQHILLSGTKRSRIFGYCWQLFMKTMKWPHEKFSWDNVFGGFTYQFAQLFWTSGVISEIVISWPNQTNSFFLAKPFFFSSFNLCRGCSSLSRIARCVRFRNVLTGQKKYHLLRLGHMKIQRALLLNDRIPFDFIFSCRPSSTNEKMQCIFVSTFRDSCQYVMSIVETNISPLEYFLVVFLTVSIRSSLFDIWHFSLWTCLIISFDAKFTEPFLNWKFSSNSIWPCFSSLSISFSNLSIYLVATLLIKLLNCLL